jgi:type II pantothenate kinase
VKINVQGAYIVDDQPPTPESPPEEDGVVYERKDIRLPHHTSVVSHVAVDVSRMQLLLRHFPAISFSSLLAEIQLPTSTLS